MTSASMIGRWLKRIKQKKIDKEYQRYSVYFKDRSLWGRANVRDCLIIRNYHKLYHDTYWRAMAFHCCGKEGQMISDNGWVHARDFWNVNKKLLLETDYNKPPERHICDT